MNARPFLKATAIAAGLALAGCTVGPDYTRPDVETPAAWNAELAMGANAMQTDPATFARWWQRLDDPLLSQLVEQAMAKNTDLRSAEARLREARARRGLSAADRFPTLEASANASRTRSSEETGSGNTNELYSAGFDASWELDLFGGKRRALEAAEATLEASEADLQDVQVSLVSEVALNYVELRTYQHRLQVAEANLGAQEETYDLTRWRAMAGLTTELDVAQARYAMEQTRSQIPPLRAGLEQAKNRLAVLLAEPPGNLEHRLAGVKPIPVAPLEIAVGVPADVLRNRPDVRNAERQLAAQTAQVGVATAARYPSFNLFGSIGLESLSLDRLTNSGARTSSVGGNIAATIFDAGRLRQNVEIETAIQEQALVNYEATVLTALEDVENALVDYANEHERRSALVSATEAAETAATLAKEEYASGLSDFQSVLDTQRSLLSLQDELASSEGEVTSNLIRLYKALGGGWSPLAEADMDTAQPRDTNDGPEDSASNL